MVVVRRVMWCRLEASNDDVDPTRTQPVELQWANPLLLKFFVPAVCSTAISASVEKVNNDVQCFAAFVTASVENSARIVRARGNISHHVTLCLFYERRLTVLSRGRAGE